MKKGGSCYSELPDLRKNRLKIAFDHEQQNDHTILLSDAL